MDPIQVIETRRKAVTKRDIPIAFTFTTQKLGVESTKYIKSFNYDILVVDTKTFQDSKAFYWQQHFENNFLLVMKYKNREGDCKVLQDYIEGGVNIGNWIGKQREPMKRGELDNKRQV